VSGIRLQGNRAACRAVGRGIIGPVDLRALRLNCLLAALLPNVLALGALGVMAMVEAGARTREDLAEAEAQVRAWAAAADPLPVAVADPRWTSAGILRLTPDRVTTEPGGRGPLPQEPTPDLLEALHRPVAREEGPWVTVAVPLPDGRVLYAERPVPPRDPTLLAALALALLASGAGLGWYLARRLYRPVEWLTEEAQAALDGRPRAAWRSSSEETRALESSITALADHYRSSRRG
jgi:HAMP domain-containing protein